MREVKQESTPLTVDEYIELELKSERRHEFINGHLIEMPGEKDINNKIAGFIYILLMNHLYPRGYEVFIHDVKVASQDRQKYFYPDVFLTKEQVTEENRYIKYEPELIVEVISPSTYITDTVDKFLAYKDIPSLDYYLLVQPETVYVTLFSRQAEGEWEATYFTRSSDTIPMPLLGIQLPLHEIYR